MHSYYKAGYGCVGYLTQEKLYWQTQLDICTFSYKLLFQKMNVIEKISEYTHTNALYIIDPRLLYARYGHEVG